MWVNTVRGLSVDINDLRPFVAERFRAAMRTLADLRVRIHVTSTTRGTPCQIAYYAKGRKSLAEVNALMDAAGLPHISQAENNVITECDGVTTLSPHQEGRAIDIAPDDGKGNPCWPGASDPRWFDIARVMRSWGFVWGKDWDDDGKTLEQGDVDEAKWLQDAPHYEIPKANLKEV